MKNIAIAFLLVFTISLGAFSWHQRSQIAQMQTQLAAGAKITVVDVRGPALFAQAHIPGAINIPAEVCARKAALATDDTERVALFVKAVKVLRASPLRTATA